jgi:hypothetical protein
MSLHVNRLSEHLPRRLPIGAKYVVEGYGGAEGNLRVIARYVLLPDGHRINVPSDVPRPAARALASRRSSLSQRSQSKRSQPKVGFRAKLAASPGTPRQSKR